MRRKLAAGNWKMHGLDADLAQLLAIAAAADRGIDVLICPPATLLHRAAQALGPAALGNGALALGGQDCHAQPSGAHTGDVSAAMLREAGASYVILGHSERREAYGETDAQVRAKAQAAQSEGLTAIVCLGESLAQRDAGRTLEVVSAQLAGSVPDGATGDTLVVAYEPVWAIGSGLTPEPGDIARVHAALREGLVRRLGAARGAAVRLLYGGSVKPDNAAAIFALPEVDGALVGGASLKAADFLPIVAALQASAAGGQRG